MGIFDKFKVSTLGIGAAKVNTIVHTNNLMPGNRIEGVCKIKGGKIEQYINDITITVYTNYKKEIDDRVREEIQGIQSHTIKVDKTVIPNEDHEVKFSFILYKRVPVTNHKCKVWLSTNLGIEDGIDTMDRDYINVDYNEYMKNVIDAVLQLGFRIREIENEYSKARLNNYNFVQEFEFVPISGRFRGKLDELELVFVPTDTYVDLYLQIDRKVRGLMSFISESAGLDETNLRIRLENSRKYTVDEIKSEIEKVLNRYS